MAKGVFVEQHVVASLNRVRLQARASRVVAQLVFEGNMSFAEAYPDIELPDYGELTEAFKRGTAYGIMIQAGVTADRMENNIRRLTKFSLWGRPYSPVIRVPIRPQDQPE